MQTQAYAHQHACIHTKFVYNRFAWVCECVISICTYIYIPCLAVHDYVHTYFRERERDRGNQKLISMEQLQIILAIFYSDQLVM